MVEVLIMSAKLATLEPLEKKVFWNQDLDVIISVYDVTSKYSSYELDQLSTRELKFGNCSGSMREVIIASIL